MTADAAHVAAVAEALAGSWRIAADSTSRAIAREVAYAEATVAVETLTPLIRAQIAAEIRAERDRIRKQYDSWLFTYGSAVEPGSRDHDSEVAMDALDTAARIAEGTP